MVLDAYYDAVRRLLGSGDTQKRITSVGFGTSAIPATPSDQALSPDAVIIPVASVSYAEDDDRTLTIHFELGSDVGNGLVITEIGLFVADGTLIARKVRQPIHKTEEMRLGETWDIQV